jgi:thioredoxin 1
MCYFRFHQIPLHLHPMNIFNRGFLILAVSLHFVLLLQSCSTSSPAYAEVGVEEFSQMLLKQKQDIILLDVRTKGEFASGALDGAINIDINTADFSNSIKSLDQNKHILVYCLSGSRTTAAAKQLVNAGFKEVTVLKQGLLAWRNAGLPFGQISAEDLQRSAPQSTLEKFNKSIAGDKLVMVDFYADWCRPCKIMEPFLDRIKNDRKDDVTVIKINTEIEMQLSNEYQIQHLPTLVLFKNNEVVYRQSGLHEYHDLNRLVDEYK